MQSLYLLHPRSNGHIGRAKIVYKRLLNEFKLALIQESVRAPPRRHRTARLSHVREVYLKTSTSGSGCWAVISLKRLFSGIYCLREFRRERFWVSALPAGFSVTAKHFVVIWTSADYAKSECVTRFRNRKSSSTARNIKNVRIERNRMLWKLFMLGKA